MLKRTSLLFVIAAGAVSLPLHAQPSPPKHEIAIVRFEFMPPRLVVQQGDVIAWVNRDVVRHDAVAVDHSWKTATIMAGKTDSITATKPGTFNYICGRHPYMKGTIVVVGPAPE